MRLAVSRRRAYTNISDAIWLAVDIVSYPHYYLDQSCEDDSEKAKVIAEIEDKAKKHGLL